MNKQELHWIHHQAGIAIQFEWEDKCAETQDCAELISTEIVGKFHDQEAWLVACHLTVTDGAAQREYWWPVTDYLVVSRREEDQAPISRHATAKELDQFGVDA
jgi:hypothetical protein